VRPGRFAHSGSETGPDDGCGCWLTGGEGRGMVDAPGTSAAGVADGAGVADAGGGGIEPGGAEVGSGDGGTGWPRGGWPVGTGENGGAGCGVAVGEGAGM
jgi:hypothetical protein